MQDPRYADHELRARLDHVTDMLARMCRTYEREHGAGCMFPLAVGAWWRAYKRDREADRARLDEVAARLDEAEALLHAERARGGGR